MKILLVAIVSTISTSLFFTSQIEIKGMVIDAGTGEDLIGASVLEKGTKNSAVTDIDGTFSIAIDQFPVTLIVSYTGFADQEITINKPTDADNLIIEMSEAELLDEVVVIGVGKARYIKKLPFTVDKVNTEALENVPATSAAGAIQGKVAGLNTQGNRNIIIRGRSSLQYSNTQILDQGRIYGNRIVENENESYPAFVENQFIRPLDEALSTFSVDVNRASYGNIRRYIKGGQLPPQEAVRIEEMINYFDYDYLEPAGADPVSIQSTLTECPWNSEHQLLHIGLQGKRIATDNLPASNFVFLIDVSGSMHDRNKLPLLKSSMKLLINQLRPKDRVAIVTYAGADQVVLKSTAASEKYAILEAIDRLDSGGSTAGAKGIQTAYRIARANYMKEGNNRIILATDGDFNVGISSTDGLKSMIEKERKSGVFLSILGYGMGNYQDDIMQTLAQAGNGNHAYIDDLQEAQKTLVHEFGGTLFTIAKDVKIQVEFNPGKVSAYRLVGYETRMLAKEDFNNDKKDAGDMGSGHSVTAIYEVIPVGSKSPYSGQVDELKYQENKKDIVVAKSDEVATIKFRYKQPDGDSSKKVEVTVKEITKSKEVGEDINWAIATASFGMKLRGSDFIDDLSYDQIIALAKRSRGVDEEGYRAEMIRLMRSARGLASEYVVSRD